MSDERTPRAGARLLVLVLAGVLATIIVFDANGTFWGGATSANATSAAACGLQPPPEVVQLRARERAKLRRVTLAVMSGRVARLYEQGVVGEANLFTDDPPKPAPATGAAPGGYEARWWALNREGREDDVVVDVLRYRDSASARLALAQAGDPHCHISGSGGSASFPAGARTLRWHNPDLADQLETLRSAGPYLYMVGDVPPPTGEGSVGVEQASRERSRVETAMDVLSCALPSAGCTAKTVARAADSAGVPALAQPRPDDSWPVTRARARRFLEAVALQPYDVPGLQPTGRQRDAGSSPFLTGCLGASAHTRVVVGSDSRPYAFRGRGVSQTAQSFLAVVADEAGAASVERAYATAFGDGCVQRTYQDYLARGAAGHSRVRFIGVRVAPLVPGEPRSYPPTEPYRAMAARLTFETAARTRRGRIVRIGFYVEVFVLAYRRALVSLLLTSAPVPQPNANMSYLASVLAGRALANWGVEGHERPAVAHHRPAG